MKKLLFLFLLTSLILFSCEEIDSSLVGNWILTESKYIITANEDFTFADIFGSPWQGTIQIENKKFNPSLFRYYFDNVWGQNHLATQELSFTFAGPKLEVEYQNIRYLMDTEYVFDLVSGVFTAQGTAKHSDKSITVDINLTLPKVELKKGEQFSVQDAYHYIPYTKLRFMNNGKLQTDFLIGDIIDIKSGKWSVNNDQLNISIKARANTTYQYQVNANSLLLSKNKTTEEMEPPHISPFAGKISKITYQALFMRE